MESINIEKYTKADGEIDFDALYMEGMSDKQKATIKRIEQEQISTGVLSTDKMLERDTNIAERKMPFQVYNNEQKERIKKAKKEKQKLEKEFESMSKRETLDVAIKQDDLMENEIINRKNKTLESLNQSEIMNVLQVKSRYGKQSDMVTGNTKIGWNIARAKPINFGSIGDFNVDGLPRSRVTCKGTDITTINIYDKQNKKNKQLISRRFCSEVLSCWARMTDVSYMSKNSEKVTAISLWGLPMEYQGTDNICEQHFINGETVIKILKDILFVIHNKPYNPSKISKQLDYLITTRVSRKKKMGKKPEDIINDMKRRISYTYQSNNLVWSYPKISPKYIIGLLNHLKSGEFGTLLTEYDTQIMVPIVNDMWKYPLKCTDYHKPKDNKDHEKQRDDYDIASYIFERD